MVPPRPLTSRSDPEDGPRERETISLRTSDGKAIEGVVLSKRPDRIQVMLGEGTHSVFCELKLTRDELAYAGRAMGREVVYGRSRAEVEADIDKRATGLGDPGS